MKLVCKVQQHLVLAYREEDNGDFFFVLCRKGFEAVLGRKLSMREKVIIEVNIKESDVTNYHI